MRQTLALVSAVIVTAFGSYAIASEVGGGEAPPEQVSAADCPEQTQVLKEAGLVAEYFDGAECPSMEDAQKAADLARESDKAAQADREEFQEAQASGELGPDRDRWMQGVGDQARPLTPPEVAQVEERIAEAHPK